MSSKRETGSNKPSVLCSDGSCFEKIGLSEENLMPPMPEMGHLGNYGVRVILPLSKKA